MKQTLKHCGLKPSDVTYIEADGTAIKSMDLEELKAIDVVYGQDRSLSNPLLIGSVKSNIGNAYNNNAINSIIKVLIAMETGVIPPNLHYSEPPEEAQCLRDGRVKVITEPTPWTDCYAAVNTAALNGSFSHIILKRHSKKKQRRKLSPFNMPRLFVASCRTQEMISSIFDILNSNRGDDELAQLITDITEKPFSNSLYSGYTVIPDFEAADSEQSIEMVQANLSVQSREIWFVFSGMGSQWTGMGESLMKIPIFAEAIKKCDVVLRPRGYDIVHIICDKNPTIYDNIINCFLGIAAIQIGLVDTLYAVGVKPNYMIGHSVGELGCSYADGCFTAEEMILSALSRGLASVESDLIHGTMAAVGLGYKQLRHFCPEDIDIACHNGPDSSTISGPTESIKAFVKELQSKGIFAKTVPTGNIAFHSRYISPAGPKLLEYLKKVISQPKNRSKRWLCTSIPKNEWHLMKAHLSSPEYHTNNLLSPVLFEEILTMLPKNAITIEVSPHGLLQAILRKSLDSGCINLSLTKRGHKDNATFILSTLGKLYNLGFPITPGKLYQRVPYPVSRETPSISPLVRWEHSSDWHVASDKFLETQQIEELVDLESDKYKFLRNFKINGNVIISSAVYLKLVVNMYSNLIPNKANNSFILENIIIHNKLLEIPRNGKIRLIIMIFKGSGKFEVKTKDEIMIASGTIRLAETQKEDIPEIILLKEETKILDEENIYSNLLLHGYQYEESYNIISGLSTSCSNGTLKWSRDWRLLLEGLVQVHIISNRNKNMLVPSRIQKLVIDMEQLTEKMKENNGKNLKPNINLLVIIKIQYRPKVLKLFKFFTT
ncbi:fatty acid synthase-like [Polistes fuscatus]|uniref:fatty acid synthase-like n=1 Tax=Polistes fuscatus TaxID=30207 RepID=UPI001CA8EDA6|nr:fatty acid synthase-like [Polistes fuscatus]